MDLMELRRSLMTTGGVGMIGELSKYEKWVGTFPDASNTNAWSGGANVPCSFTPKLVVFSSVEEADDGMIYSGVFAFVPTETGRNVVCGGVNYMNAANRSRSVGAYKGNLSDAAATASSFRFYDGVFSASRTGTNGWWSNTYEYTFEFYG